MYHFDERLVVWESRPENADRLLRKKMGQRRPGDVLIKLIFMQLIIRLLFNAGSVSRSQKDSQSLIGHH